eukprot:TCONS_00047241-protein
MGDAIEIKTNWKKKYSLDLESSLLSWIQDVTGEDLSEIKGHDQFRQKFKTGVTLCQLMNKIKPGCIKTYNKNPKLPFQQMENIGFVNQAMREYGVQSEYIFVTADLHQGKNLVTVQLGLRNLGDKATANGFQPAFKL